MWILPASVRLSVSADSRRQMDPEGGRLPCLPGTDIQSLTDTRDMDESTCLTQVFWRRSYACLLGKVFVKGRKALNKVVEALNKLVELFGMWGEAVVK